MTFYEIEFLHTFKHLTVEQVTLKYFDRVMPFYELEILHTIKQLTAERWPRDQTAVLFFLFPSVISDV